MTSSRFLKGFFTALVLYIIGDVVWHNVLFYDFYSARLMAINGTPLSTDFPPFIIAFEIIGAAVTAYFILAAQKTSTVQEGAVHGGMLGLSMVAAINFVAHSLIPKWDVTLVAVDTLWGILLGVIAGAAVVLVTKRK